MDPNASIDDMAALIAYDQALTIKLLKAANSAFVGRAMEITNVHDAISYIGQQHTLNLLISNTLGSELVHKKLTAYDLAEGQLWAHSVLASIAADQCRKLFRAEVPQETPTAALLYNVGKVILSRFIDEDLGSFLSKSKEGGMDTAESEREILEVHYGEIGGLMVQHWGLSDAIVKAITFHHDPDIVSDPISDFTHVCHLVVQHLDPEHGSAAIEDKMSKQAIDRLGPVSDDWFEQLCDRVKERYLEVHQSFGLKHQLLPLDS